MSPQRASENLVENKEQLCHCDRPAVYVLNPLYCNGEVASGTKSKLHVDEDAKRYVCKNIEYVVDLLNGKYLNTKGYFGIRSQNINTGEIKIYPASGLIKTNREEHGALRFLLRCF